MKRYTGHTINITIKILGKAIIPLPGGGGPDHIGQDVRQGPGGIWETTWHDYPTLKRLLDSGANDGAG